MTFVSKPDALRFLSLRLSEKKLGLGEEKLCLGKGFARLREPEAQNHPVSASPQRRLLCLRLGEPEVQLFPLPSVYSKNHYSFVRFSIEMNDRHEIGLVADPNK